ncbi:MAG: LemA family protein [Pseudoxanthomonas sp.]|nr:LemA family protein [Pseudoxanthomonas sp.]
MSYFAIALGILLAIALWAVLAFNRLVRLRNQVLTAWADVDVQLIRRHDLVPSLVTAVQAYAGHEQAVLTTVTELRAQAMQAQAPATLGSIESKLEAGIGRLLALREAYPDLKASENFAQLQRDLVNVEEQLQYARRFYNGAVRELNDGVQRMPDLLVARSFGFGEAEFFQADEAERAAVKVEMER